MNTISVLVTGGSGRLGSSLIKCLLEEGYIVHSLDLFEPRTPIPFCIYFKGSVTNRRDIEKAAKGVDAIFHVASKIELYPHCSEELWDINVNGTQNIIDVCVMQGISHLIYTSTLDITWDWNGLSGPETQNYPKNPSNGYIKSKIAAEKLVLEAHGLPIANGSLLKSISLRPVHIYGPGDLLAISALDLGAKGFVPLWDSQSTEFVYLDNCAYGHMLAYHKLKSDSLPGHTLRIYYLKDDYKTRYLDAIYMFAKRKYPNVKRIRVPSFVVAFIACLYTLLYWILYCFGLAWVMNPEKTFSYWHYRVLTLEENVCAKRSISELGYTQKVSNEDGLKETMKWIDSL